MLFQQFEKWLQCQILKKSYSPIPIECVITQIDQLLIKDIMNTEYVLQIKTQMDLQINNTLQINDYWFVVDYDMKQDQINQVLVESNSFQIILKNNEWDSKTKKQMKMLSVRQEFNNQENFEKISKNLIEELKSVETIQQEKQINSTPMDKLQQEQIEIIQPFHLMSDLKKTPLQIEQQESVQKNVSVNLSHQIQEPFEQLSTIVIPENMQHEAEQWIKTRKKERYHDLKYYQKLVLLQKSLSKIQVTQNLLKYPYQPSEDLKKKMIPFLTRSSDLEIFQKKVKFSKTVVQSIQQQ